MNPALIPVFVILIFAVVLALIGQAERNSKKTKANKPSGFDDWQAQERWEDYPTVNYDKVHTYCSVTFEDNGKTFYYRTRNPELKVGDLVYVPVGYRYEKKVGRITKMKDYLGYLAPYPLERTKHIIGKVK